VTVNFLDRKIGGLELGSENKLASFSKIAVHNFESISVMYGAHLPKEDCRVAIFTKTAVCALWAQMLS
jgi:hypothetical protein